MRPLPAALLLALALLTAGCVAAPQGADAPMEASSVVPVPNDFGLDLALLTGDAPARTLAAPPEWRTGEWWRIRVTDDLTRETYETTRVVAGVEGDHYLVGMAADAWSDVLMLVHLPAFGEIAMDDLSYDVHGDRFAPLRFPLQDGASWETSFDGGPVQATVRVTGETTAEIRMAGARDVVAVYDAGVGEIVSLDVDGYALVEVVEHGFGYEGVVTIPHAQTLAFLTGRVAGAVGFGLAPAPPMETITVEAGYNRMSLGLLFGTLLPGSPSAAGVYRETVKAPGGETFTATVTPADDARLHVFTYGYGDPAGEWSFEHVALGPGFAAAEGIAYHAYDLELPAGTLALSAPTGAGHDGHLKVGPSAVAGHALARLAG